MYRALYRKWRPQVFSDVSGQNHITETLRNEISSGRLSHAYLFTGSRGTGKTTCAKILAKAVNCLNPQDGSPCNECSICRGIDDGSILDVTEIDAASNNSVDNIRDLRDEVNFTPAAAKYRVYIIDEVHMLSSGAFNALLKTLEEPPQHVLFILATTEVQKLPATILSRCQRFDFRRIPPEDIAARLMTVAENENLKLYFYPSGLDFYVVSANGKQLIAIDNILGNAKDNSAVFNKMIEEYDKALFKTDFVISSAKKPEELIYHNNIPKYFTRMQAVQKTLKNYDTYIMDSKFASVCGATMDPQVQKLRNYIIMDIGNGHTLAAAIKDEKIVLIKTFV